MRDWIAAVGARPYSSSLVAQRGQLMRETPFEASGRTARRRDMLKPRRGKDHRRKRVRPLRRQMPGLIDRESPTDTCSRAVAILPTSSRFPRQPQPWRHGRPCTKLGSGLLEGAGRETGLPMRHSIRRSRQVCPPRRHSGRCGCFSAPRRPGRARAHPETVSDRLSDRQGRSRIDRTISAARTRP